MDGNGGNGWNNGGGGEGEIVKATSTRCFALKQLKMKVMTWCHFICHVQAYICHEIYEDKKENEVTPVSLNC